MLYAMIQFMPERIFGNEEQGIPLLYLIKGYVNWDSSSRRCRLAQPFVSKK